MSNTKEYNSSGPGKKGTIFGLPFDRANASTVLVPVPWDVTTSYQSGTANGPKAILDASPQIDLQLFGRKEAPWKNGIFMDVIPEKILKASKELRELVEPYMKALEDGADGSHYQEVIDKVNMSSLSLNAIVMKAAKELIDAGKMVGIVGGDHSVSYGFLEALSTKYNEFGVLQIDAHMDLRKAYEGFTHSHASSMYNAIQLPSVVKLVQVGIRDFSEEELHLASMSEKVETFFDMELMENRFTGGHWHTMAKDIISRLPHFVYVSFDIDGLNPHLCTGTGTPVPGGLEYNEAIYLLNMIVKSGRRVIGFDLCEVAPKEGDKEWNANVGARVLYNLCSVAMDH
ncbi:agmatinase family protein [Reichenbachiella versicolor]|uniref:agmatinase family protein n=1 Tax=Reichenbachiella versicolor TaxID=1821036 RepID=UPI000D6E1225|nr:agmatinase family protein [Reichenbachiella versicolor]